MKSLGQRIAFYRKRAELTQEQLAEKCAVSPQAVSKWENDLSAPDIALIVTLAEIFSISCDELLGSRRAETTVVAPEQVDLTRMLLRVKVLSADGDSVNVNLPISVADVVLKSGLIKNSEGAEILKNLDLNQIVSLVKAGAIGKLIEVKSADGDNVEVWVE